ncbi:MAG: tetratricopeptide repeat protein, partial [Vicinamibacterales bacterium]
MAALDRLVTTLLLLALTAGVAAQAPSRPPAPDCADRVALIELLNQSAAAINRGDHTTAVTLLAQMAERASPTPCAPLRGVALRRLALGDSFSGNFVSALAKLEEAVPLLRDAGVPRDEAAALVQQGYALMQVARHSEAIPVLREALARALAVKDPESVVSAYEYLVAALPPGDEERALTTAGIAYARTVPNGRLLECSLLHFQGDRRFADGRYAEALAPLVDSITCFNEIKSWGALGTAYVSLGRVYRAHGRLDLALAQHEHALAVQQREPPALHTIQTVNAIAVTLGLMGRYPEAIARLREGLALADQLRSTTYEQFLKGSLAGVYLQSGRHREAADLLEDVLRQPNPPQAATRWAQLSSARTALGESEAALVAADRGLALAGTTDIDALTATLRARISALTALGRHDDANTDLTRLLTMIERVRESTLPADDLRRGYGARHQDVFAAAV